MEILLHLMKRSEPRGSGKSSALLTLGPKCWEMFRFSPSEFFCSVCEGKKMIFLCFFFLSGIHLGL